MAISKKDRAEIAVMIARAVTATAGVIDSEAVETTAQEPESKVMSGVEVISIRTGLKPVAGDVQPGAGITTEVSIEGNVEGQTTEKMFLIQPSDEALFSELKRIQNYPHLFQNVSFIFREPPSGDRYITKIYVRYDTRR